MAELPPPPEGIVLTHFIVSDDVERSRRFYTEVLGGRVAFPGDPVRARRRRRGPEGLRVTSSPSPDGWRISSLGRQ